MIYISLVKYFLQNLSTGCPNFIVAQTPQANTINDFWSMIWSEKSRTVVCLHTPNEVSVFGMM